MSLFRVWSFLKPVTQRMRNQSLFYPFYAARCYCSQPRKVSEEFKPVYKLPYIVHARFLCKLKLYQTVVVLGLTGASVATQVELFTPLAICSLALGMLGVMGEFFRKLVGIMYVNPKTDEVTISHLNFWGNRKDVTCRIVDIIPPTDIGENLSDAYVKLTFVDKANYHLYLSVKFGQVLDQEQFCRVIGSLP